MPINNMSVATAPQWFRAHSQIKGFDRIDYDKGIIFGVAVNTEGEALGHGVHLEASFVEDVTAHGNYHKKGLKARFGHPNMSSSAVGTYVGRYRNFRTETVAGQAICRADLHLSESAKKAPQGDLNTYILEMADKEPDMFGLSIVFSRKGLYHYDENGKRKEGRGHKTFVELGKPGEEDSGKLHACDVVDEPAANPDGLFSEFVSELTAAKVTEFLDENPEVLELYANDEIREAFLERYNSRNKNKEEQIMSDLQPQADLQNNENQGLLSRLASALGFNIIFGQQPEADTSEEEPEPTEEPEAPEEETASEEEQPQADSQEETEEQPELENDGLKALEAKVEDLVKSLGLKDSEIKDLKSKLAQSEKKLSALGVAFKVSPKEETNKGAFGTFFEAVKAMQKELGISYEEAHKHCFKEYPELYPTNRKKTA